MADAMRAAAPRLVGSPRPRVAPPIPARSGLQQFKEDAQALGVKPRPWQETAARYVTALAPGGGHLYREVAILVARQQGKTEMLKPIITRRMRAGQRVLHLAQTRELPRIMFDVIATALSNEPDLFPKRRGRTIWPRYGSGQEEIKLENGATYRIAAANRGGARGQTADVVIVDELREMRDDDFMSAAEPTLTMSPDPQLIYLSNAGDESSAVLNELRDRGIGEQDPTLAYLEWSAAPSRDAGDRDGWAEANPMIGHFPQVLATLEKAYRKAQLSGNMARFETEHLCRWVPSARQAFVDIKRWAACEVPTLSQPVRPWMAVSMDPGGRRASAVVAWQRDDGTVALQHILEATGTPVIDTDAMGADLRDKARELRVQSVGYDPMTDAALTRWFPRSDSISASRYANASARFVTLAEAGRLAWTDCATVTEDLGWTTRKAHDEKGAFEAVRATDDRPITAALAAIRAVWLASEPKPRALDKSRAPVGF